MKNIKLVVFLAFVMTVYANNAQAAYSWAVGPDTVDRYYPVVGTIVYVHMDGEMHNPAGCSSNYYYSIRSSHPEFEEYKKMILTAKAAGLKLRMAIEKDAGACDGAYPKINRMYMY